MFENSHDLPQGKKNPKKRLIISTENLLGQEELNQSLSFFVDFVLLDMPKDLLKLVFQSFLNEKTLRII